MRLVYTLVFLNIIVGAGAWMYDNTITVMDSLQVVKLRLQGVRTIQKGPLEILINDRCRTGKTCRCVALIHGLGDNAMTWSNVLVAAPEDIRVYAPNMPGAGRSVRPQSDDAWRIPSQAGVLHTVLSRTKGCQSWTVAGNSLGGWTGSWLALKWPQGVEKLVLLNSAGLKDSTGASETAAKTLAQPTISSMKDFSKRAYHNKRSVPERVWPDIIARILRRGTFEIGSSIKDEDFLDGRLAALKIPVTILWGASDRIIPLSQAIRFKEEIPHAKVLIEEQCGHLPQKECPQSLLTEIYEKY